LRYSRRRLPNNTINSDGFTLRCALGKAAGFGAIHCSRARANIFDKQIQDFRARTGLSGELKWSKVSRAWLTAYTEFVDIFLDDQYATFILSEISKGEHWRNLASSADSRFLHAYFHFLEQAMWASARYAIFLDETSSKRYKFNSFHYALNLPDIRYHRQKKVHTFTTVSSHESNLIQMVDVLLGALAARPGASHKISLSNYVREKIKASTKFGRPKLVTYEWVAPETRRFKPQM
jgi:hypothetical protein